MNVHTYMYIKCMYMYIFVPEDNLKIYIFFSTGAISKPMANIHVATVNKFYFLVFPDSDSI